MAMNESQKLQHKQQKRESAEMKLREIVAEISDLTLWYIKQGDQHRNKKIENIPSITSEKFLESISCVYGMKETHNEKTWYGRGIFVHDTEMYFRAVWNCDYMDDDREEYMQLFVSSQPSILGPNYEQIIDE